MPMELSLALAGLTVGALVGTDFVFAALTKTVDTALHHDQHSVDWRVTPLSCAGRLPPAMLTVAAGMIE